MAVGRISGPLLKANLERNGIDLAVETDLLYIDVNNGRIGIKTNTPQYDLDVDGIIKTTRIDTDFLTVNSNYNIGNVNITSTVGNLVLQPGTLSDRTVILGDLEVTGEILDLAGGFNIVNDASSSIFVDNGSDIRFSDGVDTVISLSSDATHEIIEINNTSTLDSVTGRGNTTTNNITVGSATASSLFTSLIDTTDSSAITVVPAAVFSSDVTVENDLTVTNKVTAAEFIGDGSQLTGLVATYADLTDTDITGRTANSLTRFDGATYVPTAMSEDASGNVTFTNTDDGSSAAPEIILYRNSASPTNGDYLGQIQFKGRNDGNADEIYAKVTGKISDASNGTEDGLIETAIKGNGSFTIVSRQRSDELQLINGVGLNVDGNIVVNGTVDGRDIATDGAKLDGIETGATADQTAADIRGLGFFDTTNDGAGSGLDADVLDGQEGSYYLDWTNTTNKPDPVITLNGDASGSVTLTDLASGTLTATLATVNSNVGSFGSATAIPVVTVNAKGLVTAVSTASISTDLATAGDSGTGTVALASQSLTISGTTNEIETSASGQSVIIGLPNSVAITTSLTVGGNSVLTTANEGSGNGLDADTVDGIEAAALTQSGDSVALTGDVTGTTTVAADGTISVATTIAANSVELGTDTTGNYVATVSGTTNEIEVSGSGSETAAVTVGLPSDVTIGNELTVTTALYTPTIDTTDSSAITVVPAATFNSDVTVENSLTVSNDVNVGSHIDYGLYYSRHAPYQEGRMWYDQGHATINYWSDDPNVVHEIGLEEHQRVYNNTGSTILKGQPLYFSGNYTSGSKPAVPTVGLADATDVNAYNAQGIAAGDIANNSYGYCLIAGQLFDVDTSALTAGTNFFVGLTPGAVQNTGPVYPNYPMCLGWVVKSDATSGILLVNQQNHSVPSFRVRTAAHIGDDLVVDGDLIVNGTTTSTSSANIGTGAAYIYLNSGDTIGEANTTFTGSGLDDAYFSGHYSGTTTTTYYVRIDSTGTPDTFEWSKDNFSTTEATGVAITGAAQTLDNGIEIDFGATTGHTSGDVWSGTAAPANVDTGFFSNRNTGTTGVGYTHMGLFWDVTDNKWKIIEEYDPEPSGSINTAHASYNEATLVADTFEAASGVFSSTLTLGGNNVLTTANEGSGNGLDADTVDGIEAAALTQSGDSVALTGDVTGSTTVAADGTISVATTIAANSVALGTDTTGNYVQQGATSGNGLSGSVNSEGGTFTVTSNATDANTASTIVFRDASGNFSAGTITAALSGNATTASALSSAVTVELTGDVTGSATFTSAGDTASIATTIAANSVELGTDTTGNYVATITGTTNEIEVTGSGSETAAVTIGLPNDVTIGNDLTVTGDLIVNGTTTTVNSNTVEIGDSIITLNSDEAGTPSQNAGIEVERGTSTNVQLRWNETNDKWEVTEDGSTYSNILTTADEGSGNGLDADTLDGQEGTYYLDGANFTGTLPNDYVTLGTMTTGNYIATVTGTTNQVDITGSGSETAAITVSLPDTVILGSNDADRGSLYLYGAGTGEFGGSEIRLYTSADYDSNINYWKLQPRGEDFVIEKDDGTDFLRLDYSNDYVDMPLGRLELGSEDTSYGEFRIHGDGTGSSQGGIIRIYTAADHDTTNDFYRIKAWNDELVFEKSDSTDIFTYNNIDGSFRFPDGLTYIGTMDSAKGSLYLTGDGAGSADGGELRIYNAADHDTNVNYYSVYAESEDFLISYGSDDFLQYDHSAAQWLMPQSGGLSVTGNVVVSGQLEVSTIDTSDSSAITIIPGATFNSDVTVENELKVRNGIENISGDILLPASLGSADQVLTVSSDGTRAEWKAATGGGGGGGTLRLEEFPVVNNGSADVTLSQAFTLSQLDVYLNGARLKSTTDFTVSGTTLTFSNTLSTGDVVAVYIYDTSTVLSLVTGNWGSLNDVNVTGQATNTLNKFNGTAYVPALTTEDGSGNMTVTGTVTATSIQGDARDDIIEISTALALALGF